MMAESDSAPMYNLKAVVTETGLKPDTLRAWERRYGLPEPHRTPSGHRLYSEYDIKILKWLIARQHEGLSISHAVSYWHRLIEEGKDPISVVQEPTQSQPLAAQVNAITSETSESSLGIIDQLRQRWIFACLAFDERQSEQILEQAFSHFSTETVCLKILQHGLAELGIGWLQGTVTPQQEHFASSLAMRRLQALISATPPAIKTERILVGCPSGEMHTFSSTLLTLLLRRRGWDVVYLGANIPIDHIFDTVSSMHPDLVVLGAQQLHTAATLLEVSMVLSTYDIPLAFGGYVFSQNEGLQEQIPGHYLGNKIDTAVRAIEQILQLSAEDRCPSAGKARESHNSDNMIAATTFQNQRMQIESEIWQQMESAQIDSRFLIEANLSIGRTIHAILMLQLRIEQIQDIDGQWLCNTLASRYTIPNQIISLYLFAYAKAMQNRMQQEADTAVQWLQKLGTLQEPANTL